MVIFCFFCFVFFVVVLECIEVMIEFVEVFWFGWCGVDCSGFVLFVVDWFGVFLEERWLYEVGFGYFLFVSDGECVFIFVWCGDDEVVVVYVFEIGELLWSKSLFVVKVKVFFVVCKYGKGLKVMLLFVGDFFVIYGMIGIVIGWEVVMGKLCF